MLSSDSSAGPRVPMLAALTLSVLGILGALALEVVLGLVPCELCLVQRWAYYIGIPLILAATVADGGLPRPVGLALSGAAIIVFAWGSWMGAYHAGVEWGFWSGPASCTGLLQDIDLGAIRDMSPVIRCDTPQFRVLGISLAGYSAVLCATVVVLIGTVLFRRRPVR